jgi:hypothetical protein
LHASKILFSISIIAILLACIFISQVQAISQKEITLVTNWSQPILYQGDNGNVRIHLYSTCGDELEFTWIGIHFSWMGSNQYFSNYLSTKIPSNGDTEFAPIDFNIASNAPVGSDTIQIRVNFKEHHWYGWTDEYWAASYQISIHDSFEKAYYNLQSQVGNKISDRISNSNYEGPQARSSISQASNEFNLANTFATQGSWQEALGHLTTAANLVDQAAAQEQEYKAQKQQQEQQQTQQAQQSQTIQQQWVIIGVVLVIVVIIAIILGLTMKNRKKPI